MTAGVLAIVETYLPGYRAGGPVRSLANLVHALGEDFQWSVLTRDRDFHTNTPFQGLQADVWQPCGSARVFYASARHTRPAAWLKMIRDTPHDVLYLNSFFSPLFSLLPVLALRVGFLPRKPVVVAPRGEFSPGALSLKSWKKRHALSLATATGLHRSVLWHASTELEAADICRTLRVPESRVFVARNLSVPLLADIPAPAPAPAPAHGAKTVLRVMFASRIARTKNLAFALKCLQLARTNVCLTVIGPTEDIAYWAECQALMKALPSQVSVVYLGGMPPHTLAQELPKHDVFFLPTLGENFGHALVEAWQAGLSVLTSDQTPWRNLHTKRLGWDLPLGNPQSFADALAEVAGWCPEERQARREHCAEFGREVVRDEAAIDANRRLFLAAVRGKEAWRGLRF